MSVNLVIRAYTKGKTLHHLYKQAHFRNVYTTCSSSTKLAQSYVTNPTFSSVNYATNASANKTTEWTTIYRLPLIRLAAGFQRLKIYQGLFTTIALPISFGLSQVGHISPSSVAIVGSIGVSGLVTLSLFSLLIRNLIGFIYINNELDKVKVAYVDFWGKRCESIIDINDLDVDWSKARPTAFNIYQKIRLYSDKNQMYKLMLNYGVIVEPQTFTGIFGE
ncbi:unnamed protein product [Ceratitis capitata]|uniref:Transmembrane protein 186 n=1 Tax=Ceratitis capitata TaxID=7213 RepID=A0A811VAQ7_CERCA|nr:unnamed protein product [Ceratitis capitata]